MDKIKEAAHTVSESVKNVFGDIKDTLGMGEKSTTGTTTGTHEKTTDIGGKSMTEKAKETCQHIGHKAEECGQAAKHKLEEAGTSLKHGTQECATGAKDVAK